MSNKKIPVGDFYQDWKVLRQHKLKFFLVRSTALYGVPVWVITSLLSWAFGLDLFGNNALLFLGICCLLGFAYTFLEWKYNEMKFRNMQQAEERGGDGPV